MFGIILSRNTMKYVTILCTTTFGDGLIVLEILLYTSKILKFFKQSRSNLNNTQYLDILHVTIETHAHTQVYKITYLLYNTII